MITEIHAWDDWFELCGEAYETVGQYETEAYRLLQLFVIKKDKRLVEREMDRYRRENLKRDFHKNFGNRIKQAMSGLLKRCLPAPGVSFAAALLVSVVYTLVKKLGFSGRLVPIFLVPAGVALGIYALAWGVSVGVIFLKWKLASRRLSRLEEILEDQIRWVPPKYRNSFCMEQSYKLWKEYDDMTFQEACQSLDAHMRKHGLKTPFRTVLFDIPYENTKYLDASHDTQQAYGSDEEEKSEETVNPNLPPDIASKTFSGSEDAEAELDGMVGMASVKEQLKRMKNRISFYGSSNTGGGSHIAFMGSPGTGKTVTARIVTRILYDFGYIQKNKCVEIDGDYLKSPYVGQTGERTSAIVQYAMGGVLFIDEAYLLYDKNNASAAEAVGVLLKAMEDSRKDFVVIFAGYPDKMNRLLNMNEGFASRIKYRIYFDDYTVDELWDIFLLFLDRYVDDAYIVDETAETLIRRQFEIEKGLPHFGNARTARNALDSIMDYHADNCVAGANDKSQRNHITEADVKLWLRERGAETANDTRNFVGASDMDESIITTAELRQHDRGGVSDPNKALKGFVGLAQVKSELEHIREQAAFYGEGGSAGHMFFIGPQGTGKSAMAPVVTGYLHQAGCIRDNRYVSVTGDFLRGIYVGQTGRRVQAVIQYSLGGVLFIDGISALCGPDTKDAFGAEALSVLQQAMSGHESDLSVIFAGTEEEIGRLCRMAPGIDGLIRHQLRFAPFSARELCMIFKKTAAENRFTVEDSVWSPLQKFYAERMKKPDFANARDAQRLFDAVRRTHIRDYGRIPLADDSTKFVITLKDVTDTLERSV